MLVLVLECTGAISAWADMPCSDFEDNIIRTAVNENILAEGIDCIVAASGSVNGGILQTGPGSVIVSRLRSERAKS